VGGQRGAKITAGKFEESGRERGKGERALLRGGETGQAVCRIEREGWG